MPKGMQIWAETIEHVPRKECVGPVGIIKFNPVSVFVLLNTVRLRASG